jgi:serine/threonine-protein kinase
MTDGALGAGLPSLPYLVMEYVDGEPLDRYCDRRALPVPDRVRLFCGVCAAVEYAHQHRVVHRDLKPSNILVADRRASTGPEAAVKLLDFGIAKLVDEGAGPDAAGPRTRTGMHLMTPEYASPEQVRGERVTPASDVYALGVLLYELLTGRRPYGLETRSPTDVQRAVLETEPERPSAVVGSPRRRRCRARGGPARGGPARRERRRGLTVERHRRLLQGDLDAIVLKALRKEPGRRYASAEALREDLAAVPRRAARRRAHGRVRLPRRHGSPAGTARGSPGRGSWRSPPVSPRRTRRARCRGRGVRPAAARAGPAPRRWRSGGWRSPRSTTRRATARSPPWAGSRATG